MNNAPQVATQGVSVRFAVTKADNPKADSDRRIVVTGLAILRAADFVRELYKLVPHSKFVEFTPKGTIVDLESYSEMTKYQFDDQVTIALQNIGVPITPA